jgi:hypothetical protein
MTKLIDENLIKVLLFTLRIAPTAKYGAYFTIDFKSHNSKL